jgi:DNA-binding transcriptional ArsR family regulator
MVLTRFRRSHQRMSVLQPARPALSPQQNRDPHAALLDGRADELLSTVREVICEPTRSQIVRVLTAGPLSVGDLASILDRSKSATSQHLRVLRNAGIVSARRRGRVVEYTLTATPMVDAAVNVLNTAASLSVA